MSLRTVLKRGLCSTGVSSTLARRDGASFIPAAHIVLDEEAELLADVIRLLQQSFSPSISPPSAPASAATRSL